MPRKKDPFDPAALLPVTRQDVEEARAAGIEEEIDLLRHFIQRIALRQPSSLSESAEVLRVLALAVINLNQLLRTRKLQQDTADPLKQWQKKMAALEHIMRKNGHIR